MDCLYYFEGDSHNGPRAVSLRFASTENSAAVLHVIAVARLAIMSARYSPKQRLAILVLKSARMWKPVSFSCSKRLWTGTPVRTCQLPAKIVTSKLLTWPSLFVSPGNTEMATVIIPSQVLYPFPLKRIPQ